MAVCNVCGGDQFSLHDGFYFCDECQTQSQDIRDMTAEDQFQVGTVSRNYVVSEATRARRQRIREMKAEQRAARSKIGVPHAVNLLLQRWTATLVARGAPPQLAEATAQLWELVLRSGHGRLSTMDAVALLWLALVDCEPLCRMSDLFRWSRQGILPVFSAHNEMPEDVSTDWRVFHFFRGLNAGAMREKAKRLVKSLGLPPPAQPSLHQLLRRLLDELLLPEQLADVVTNLAQLVRPPDPYLPEASALAMLLVTLKMLLGLDDATEVRNSAVAAARNDAVSDEPRWFVFTEWLEFVLRARAELSEQDYAELETADRGLVMFRGPDLCRHWHRQLLFDYFRREGAFRKLETINPRVPFLNRDYGTQTRKLFGREKAPLMPPPPSDNDDLLRPVASRLDRQGGESLRRADEFRRSRVDYLLDEAPLHELQEQGVALAVTDAAARQRLPSDVSISLPHVTMVSRDVQLVSDPKDAGGEDLRRSRKISESPRSPPPDDLRLFRPYDEIWRLQKRRATEWLTKAEYRMDAEAWPIVYRCLVELLAASIEMRPSEFAGFVFRAEEELVGTGHAALAARARRQGKDPRRVIRRERRNVGHYNPIKRKRRAVSAEVTGSTSETAQQSSEEAQSDPEDEGGRRGARPRPVRNCSTNEGVRGRVNRRCSERLAAARRSRRGPVGGRL